MEEYVRLSPKHAVGFAAPHTWAACIYSVLVGGALAFALEGAFHPLVLAMVLVAAILMQSSVNAFNDYYDFIQGNDNVEDSDSPGDAILVYNKINPRQVKTLGACFMAVALLLGIYPVYRGGIAVLVIGALGCVIILLYSGGKKSISYTPLGELAAFFGDGLEVPAVFLAIAGAGWGSLPSGFVNGSVFFLAIPVGLAPALITMTNNICDIERDSKAGRRGLMIMFGRPRAIVFYLGLITLWVVSIIVCVALFFPKGIILALVLIAASSPLWGRLYRLPYVPERRGQCMSTILIAVHVLGISYVAPIVMHALRG